MRLALFYLLLKWYAGGVDQWERFTVPTKTGTMYIQIDNKGDDYQWDRYIWWADLRRGWQRAWKRGRT